MLAARAAAISFSYYLDNGSEVGSEGWSEVDYRDGRRTHACAPHVSMHACRWQTILGDGEVILSVVIDPGRRGPAALVACLLVLVEGGRVASGCLNCVAIAQFLAVRQLDQ